MQTEESISYLVAGPQAVDQSGRRIQSRMESTRQVSRQAAQHAVYTVQAGVHQCNGYWTTRGSHQRLCMLSFRSFGGICETASCPVINATTNI